MSGAYITQSLHRGAQRTPDRAMTVCGDRSRTFAESRDRIGRYAGLLRSVGVGAGDRVAILALNSDFYIETLLAVAWADAVINPVNIRWSLDEIAFSLRDSGTRVLVVDDEFARLGAQVRTSGAVDVLLHLGDGAVAEGGTGVEAAIDACTPVEDARRSGVSLAGIFYTGGTTGRPKGVMLSHDNIVWSVLGRATTASSITEGGTCLIPAPLFHMAGFSLSVGSLIAGQTQVLLPRFDADAVLDTVERLRIDDILLVPTMIRAVLDHPTAAERDLSSVKNLTYGASPISESLLERVMGAMPGVRLQQAYGMTELAPMATILTPEDHADRALLRSAGRAAAHVEVRIVDSDDREVDRGAVGEIAVRGPNVMLGYWNRPDETAEALRGGWMHTGDLGWMDGDGYVFLADRLKDMIVTGAENVYSVEVENAIMSHPLVVACAVIGVPDDEWGERVHAVLVLSGADDLALDDLRAHCAARVAGYKCPRSLEVVEALPLSAAGKVLKQALRAPHWADRERSVG